VKEKREKRKSEIRRRGETEINEKCKMLNVKYKRRR